MPDEYVWAVWSTAFLLPWGVLFVSLPRHRKRMLWVSLVTAPFGLTEPLFVPEYWSPPSLFGLALQTGFDIESIVFSFAIGGIGAIVYDAFRGSPALESVDSHDRHVSRHRFHRWALAAPALVFAALFVVTDWNPIYPAILGLTAGAVAAIACRPDLTMKTVGGAMLFLLLYVVLVGGSELSAPGYIERVWNLDALSGMFVWVLPLEEVLFALSFGAYWSGVYEHFTWTHAGREPLGARPMTD